MEQEPKPFGMPVEARLIGNIYDAERNAEIKRMNKEGEQ